MSLDTASIDTFPNPDDMYANVATESTVGDKKNDSKSGFVITATSAIGGTGKTTLAITLAHQIVKSSQKAVDNKEADKTLKVCVVDLDIFDGHLAHLFWAKAPNTLSMFLSDKPLNDELVRHNLIYVPKMDVHVLLTPRAREAVRKIPVDFYIKTIGILKTMFDVVVLDTSSATGSGHMLSEIAFPLSDSVLLVTGTSEHGLKGAENWVKTATLPILDGGKGIELSKIGVVLNSVPTDETTTSNYVKYVGMVPVLASIPRDEKFICDSLNNGKASDVITHPTIGPAYCVLAQKIVQSRATKIKI